MTYSDDVNDAVGHYATSEELAWLRTFSAKHPKGHGVVLGIGPGVMLLALKEGSGDFTISSFDLGQFWARFYLRDAHLEEGVELISGDSTKKGLEWSGDKVDLLIVDTDHTEVTTRSEIEAWLPHVKKGGTIFFHDYDADGTWFADQERYPGVKLAVDDLMSKHRFLERVGTAVVYRKV